MPATPVVPTSSAACFSACCPPCPCTYCSSCSGGYSHYSSQRRCLESHYCRRGANRPLASLPLQVLCTPWPALPRRTGSPATPGPPTSVACASSTSFSVRSLLIYVNFTHGVIRLRTARRRATPALRLAPSCSLKARLKLPHLESDGPTPPVRQHDGVTIAETRSRHGFTYATELIPLPEGPWPVTHRDAAPALRAIDTTLDQGHWTPEPDVRNHPAGATGLLSFTVHEAHCQQAKQKDRRIWKDTYDAYQAAAWNLTGYFLAHSTRLVLPDQPLHIPQIKRQVGCLTFHMQLSHVLRVGHLVKRR